jgi:hypothetical protein
MVRDPSLSAVSFGQQRAMGPVAASLGTVTVSSLAVNLEMVPSMVEPLTDVKPTVGRSGCC